MADLQGVVEDVVARRELAAAIARASGMQGTDEEIDSVLSWATGEASLGARSVEDVLRRTLDELERAKARPAPSPARRRMSVVAMAMMAGLLAFGGQAIEEPQPERRRPNPEPPPRPARPRTATVDAYVWERGPAAVPRAPIVDVLLAKPGACPDRCGVNCKFHGAMNRKLARRAARARGPR